jgi:hypothetical protein
MYKIYSKSCISVSFNFLAGLSIKDKSTIQLAQLELLSSFIRLRTFYFIDELLDNLVVFESILNPCLKVIQFQACGQVNSANIFKDVRSLFVSLFVEFIGN